MVTACICHVGFHVLLRLGPVEMRYDTADVDALAHGRITLQLEFLIPQLGLPHQNQRHRTHRVKAVVEKETEFLYGLFLQKMSLIQHADDLFVFRFPDQFNLILQLALCVASVKPGFDTKLVEQTLVEPSWRQLRIRQVQQHILIIGKFFGYPADHGRLSASGIRSDHNKELFVGGIHDPAHRLRHCGGFVEGFYGNVPCERRILHSVEFFKHRRPPFRNC